MWKLPVGSVVDMTYSAAEWSLPNFGACLKKQLRGLVLYYKLFLRASVCRYFESALLDPLED